MSNELRQMQEELARLNAQQGRPLARGEARELVDKEGYAPPASPPLEERAKQAVGDQPIPPEGVIAKVTPSTPAYSMPVEHVNLSRRIIYGSIGKFDLDDQDVSAFIALATKAMRRAIDAIERQYECDAPGTTAKEGRVKKTTTARTKPPPAASSAPTTGRKRGRPKGSRTKNAGAARQPALPIT